MKINKLGLELIKHFEELRLSAYDDGFGTWTLGYGSTHDVTEGMIITEQEADKRLLEDLKEAEDAVNELVEVKLTPNQFSALVAFTFNIGSTAFSDSTLLRLLNRGEYENIPDQLLRWNKVDSKFSFGLTRRRVAEIELFLTD